MRIQTVTFKKENTSSHYATDLAADPYEIDPDYGSNIKTALASVNITASVDGAAAAAYTNYSATVTRVTGTVEEVLDATTFKMGDKQITITANDPTTSGGSTYASSTIDLSVAAPTSILTVGKKYAITATHSDVNYELTAINSSNLGTTTTYDSTISSDYPLTVCNGSYEDTISLKTSAGTYLSWSDGNTLTTSATVTSASTWLVTGTLAKATITNAADDSRVLYFNYNSGSTPRFVCYASYSSSYDYPAFTEIVDAALTDFTIDATAEVYVGATADIGVTYNPNNATDKTLTWTSSDTAIATVSNGTVTGVAAGTATITASKEINGETVSRTCTVTVKAAAAEHAGTEADPYTVAEARAIAAGTISGTKSGAYVKGLITDRTIASSYINVWMGDTADQKSATTGGFEIYGLSSYSPSVAEVGAKLKVGATIVAYGDITAYNTTYEFNKNTGTITYNSYEEAMNWATAFNTAMTTACASTKDNGFNIAIPDSLASVMAEQGTAYNALEDIEKAHVVAASASATGDVVEQAVATYDYIVKKYTGVTEFITGRVVSSASSISSFDTSKTNVLPIAVIAASGLLATAGIFLVRRKHLGK